MSYEHQEREDIALIIKIGKQVRKAKDAIENARAFKMGSPMDELDMDIMRRQMFDWETQLNSALSDLRNLQKREEAELQQAISEG